jgi:polyisoprenoid-binding protein YceI
MIRTTAAALLLALGLAGAASAAPSTTDPAKVPAGSYVLDKKHASLTVKIVHMGFSHYTMRFDSLDGSFTYDPANFEADKYPTITFVSTGLQGGADGKGTLTGDLTFHGVTKPVTLDVTFDGAGHGITPIGTRLGFSGSTRIKRSDFGVSNMLQYASDDVDVIFEVEFEKK